MRAERHRATVAGVLIGIGLGGFVDGIARHQTTPWYHRLANMVPPQMMRVHMP